jgi:hypothetical protein
MMIQRILADRFKLQVHQETKESAVYAMVISAGGPKIKVVTLVERTLRTATQGFQVKSGTWLSGFLVIDSDRETSLRVVRAGCRLLRGYVYGSSIAWAEGSIAMTILGPCILEFVNAAG